MLPSIRERQNARALCDVLYDHIQLKLKIARCEPLCTPNLMFPVTRRELTPVSWIAQVGCRGVTGPVPQPLCMKFKLARLGANLNVLDLAHNYLQIKRSMCEKCDAGHEMGVAFSTLIGRQCHSRRLDAVQCTPQAFRCSIHTGK